MSMLGVEQSGRSHGMGGIIQWLLQKLKFPTHPLHPICPNIVGRHTNGSGDPLKGVPNWQNLPENP
jgi:hypothetical protein